MNPPSDLPHPCARCGADLPDAPEGLCPRCLMAEALHPTLTGAPLASLPVLTPAELAPHFPQLEIIECLGRGGMGVVYKARQKSLNRLVALKLLAPERAEAPQFAERFSHEAKALAALNHPNIVTVYDFGQAGDFYFLLMEFVDGVNLRQLLQAKKLAPQEALSIVPPVCHALQCAHDHGIVHRDIKPENLLIDKAGVVKIADFGIAKMVGAGPSSTAGMGEGGDSRSQPLGTPAYAAPEQNDASAGTDHRADIYSLGVVLYEMLTGERPQSTSVVPPSKRMLVDVRIDEIVLRALEKTPELRFQTAAEFRTQVETLSSSMNHPVVEKGLPQDAEGVSAARSSRPLVRMAGFILLGLGALAFIGAVVASFAFAHWARVEETYQAKNVLWVGEDPKVYAAVVTAVNRIGEGHNDFVLRVDPFAGGKGVRIYASAKDVHSAISAVNRAVVEAQEAVRVTDVKFPGTMVLEGSAPTGPELSYTSTQAQFWNFLPLGVVAAVIFGGPGLILLVIARQKRSAAGVPPRDPGRIVSVVLLTLVGVGGGSVFVRGLLKEPSPGQPMSALVATSDAFGPVHERTMKLFDQANSDLQEVTSFDLATGREASSSNAPAQPQGSLVTRADLLHDQKGVASVLFSGPGITFRKAPGRREDFGHPSQLAQTLEKWKWDDLFNPPFQIPDSAKSAREEETPPADFVFYNREGGFGVLRLIDFNAEQKTARISYQLADTLQNRDIALRQVAPLRATLNALLQKDPPYNAVAMERLRARIRALDELADVQTHLAHLRQLGFAQDHPKILELHNRMDALQWAIFENEPKRAEDSQAVPSSATPHFSPDRVSVITEDETDLNGMVLFSLKNAVTVPPNEPLAWVPGKRPFVQVTPSLQSQISATDADFLFRLSNRDFEWLKLDLQEDSVGGPDDWDKITAEKLIALFAQAESDKFVPHFPSTGESYSTYRIGQIACRAFRTRGNVIGVMQLQGYPDHSHPGVLIRYKLVQGASSHS